MAQHPDHPELVVLLDPDGRPVGTAPKAAVHDEDTPLHLAFSVHVFDAAGRVLLTRRALSKRTWPGVWTGSCCGHPGPGEDPADAVRRRCRDELGLELDGLELVDPDFRYRAVDASGTVEHEVCPVWVATAAGPPRPDPAEVAEVAWSTPGDVLATADATPYVLSPWLVWQLQRPVLRARFAPAGEPVGA